MSMASHCRETWEIQFGFVHGMHGSAGWCMDGNRVRSWLLVADVGGSGESVLQPKSAMA